MHEAKYSEENPENSSQEEEEPKNEG